MRKRLIEVSGGRIDNIEDCLIVRGKGRLKKISSETIRKKLNVLLELIFDRVQW